MAEYSLKSVIGTPENNFLQSIELSDQEIIEYVEKARLITVSISKEAEKLIRMYFMATRRTRQGL